VTFGDTQITEISRQGRGWVHMFPGTRTVVDMGGQDTKAIRVSPTGEIADFCMNDKCAAGTGRFLGAAAAALEIPLGELGVVALRAEKPVKISTTCTVFAESEVVSWLGKGKKIEDILLGVHPSIVSRSLGLMRRVGIERGGDVHRRRDAQHRRGHRVERHAGLRGQRQRRVALHGGAGRGAVCDGSDYGRARPGVSGQGVEEAAS
jgi:predicted CoA-substrate-specific enzyme activase